MTTPQHSNYTHKIRNDNTKQMLYTKHYTANRNTRQVTEGNRLSNNVNHSRSDRAYFLISNTQKCIEMYRNAVIA